MIKWPWTTKAKSFANTPTLEAMCLIICTDGWMDWWINLKMQKRETRAKSCWRPSLFRGRGRFDEQRFQCVHYICKWRPFPWFTVYHIRLIIHFREFISTNHENSVHLLGPTRFNKRHHACIQILGNIQPSSFKTYCCYHLQSLHAS